MIAGSASDVRHGTTANTFGNDLDAIRALGSFCATPESRTDADGLTERAGQMALIMKTTNSGNLREILVGS